MPAVPLEKRRKTHHKESSSEEEQQRPKAMKAPAKLV
jgi:hypothetical protein